MFKSILYISPRSGNTAEVESVASQKGLVNADFLLFIPSLSVAIWGPSIGLIT